MAFVWKREDTRKLVAIIKQYKCIYDIWTPDYSSRTKKAQAFNKILMQMKHTLPEITIHDIKKKWSNLRIQFATEQRRIKKSKKSGTQAGTIYEPKLWCFDEMLFLIKHTQPSKHNNDISTESIDSLQYHTQAKEKKLSCVKTQKNNFKSHNKKYYWLGTLVTSQMKEIDSEYQGKAAREVMSVMQGLVEKSKNRTLQLTSGELALSSNTEQNGNILEKCMEIEYFEEDSSTL